MEDVLAKMNEDKRINLINSAMKEFGSNRFDKASTNVIVKEAGISKGLLYHYFESKEKLYDYLIVFAINIVGKAIFDNVLWDDGDLIKRMQKVIEIKLEIFEKYPYMFDFGKTMYESKSSDEIKKIIDDNMPELYPNVYTQNIDYSMFKENINIKKAIKMIQLFLDGYAEQLLPRYKTANFSKQELKQEMSELAIYLDMYKEAFYK